MKAVVASAPGKINLALLVGPAEESGYHPLSTVFEAIGLREYVCVFAARQTNPDSESSVRVSTLLYKAGSGRLEDPSFDAEATTAFHPLDGRDHLASRAARLLVPNGWDFDIEVHKTLPVAGGMAGGSADAAATLVAVNELTGLGLTSEELEVAGRALGADVPACLLGGISVGLGRGDHMKLLEKGTVTPGPKSRWWVAAFAQRGLSTAQVFQDFDATSPTLAMRLPDEVPGQTISPQRIESLLGESATLDRGVQNDLAEIAFAARPELREVGERSERAGAILWMLSGSGPTIVALAEDEDHAQAIAEEWRQLPQVKDTALTWGPNIGARIEDRLPGWCSAR